MRGAEALTPAIILSLFLCGSSTLLHYECLKLLSFALPRAAIIKTRAKVLAALGGAIVSHLSQIMLFAGAYFLLRDKFGLGGFGGQFKDVFSSFVSFTKVRNAFFSSCNPVTRSRGVRSSPSERTALLRMTRSNSFRLPGHE